MEALIVNRQSLVVKRAEARYSANGTSGLMRGRNSPASHLYDILYGGWGREAK